MKDSSKYEFQPEFPLGNRKSAAANLGGFWRAATRNPVEAQ